MFSRYPASHHHRQVSRTRRKRQDKFKRKRIGNISLRNLTDRQNELFIRTTFTAEVDGFGNLMDCGEEWATLEFRFLSQLRPRTLITGIGIFS
jgi:hypothetical protein